MRAQGAGPQIETVDGREEFLGFRKDLFAVFRQLEPGAAALAEFDAKPGFQRADLVADRRGGDVEDGLRGGEAASLDDRGEDAQQAQIDSV